MRLLWLYGKGWQARGNGWARIKSHCHADIGNLLQAAYGRKFTKQEMVKCKTKFPDAMSWHKTLSEEQKEAVDNYIKGVNGMEYIKG